jgi:hypothetical protein
MLLEYPELEGDEARRAIWLYDVPLGATHHLRKVMNDSNVDYREVFPRYEIPIVASVLKLYLLELPGLFPEDRKGMFSFDKGLTPLFHFRFSRFLSSL